MRTIIIAALLCGMMAGCTNSNKQTTGNNTAERIMNEATAAK